MPAARRSNPKTKRRFNAEITTKFRSGERDVEIDDKAVNMLRKLIVDYGRSTVATEWMGVSVATMMTVASGMQDLVRPETRRRIYDFFREQRT